ncbi:MAG: hypothetical protein JOZ49_17095 [Mycolicibacterium sp.]|nr:hypothetical protein [Mycolicibacterium sp.]
MSGATPARLSIRRKSTMPLNLSQCWVGAHLGYTIANYGMSLTTVGLASELKAYGVTVHALWPRTTIATAAIVKHGPPR